MINVTILRILYRITLLLTVSSLLGCASMTLEPSGKGRLADPDDSIKIRSTDDAAYKEQSDLMYEVLVGELSGQFGDVEQALTHYLNASMLSDDPDIAERATRIAMFAKDWNLGCARQLVGLN